MAKRNGNPRLDKTEAEHHLRNRQHDIKFCEAMARAISMGLEHTVIGVVKAVDPYSSSATFVPARRRVVVPGQWCID